MARSEGQLTIQGLAGGRPGAAAVDDFLRGHDFPLVEGEWVTFVYRGQADQVRLRHWSSVLPEAPHFGRARGTDLWYLVVRVPRGYRIEYKIEVVSGAGSRWIEDPLNPRRATDPFGANSVLHASGYETPDWAVPDPAVPQGRLEQVGVAAASRADERTVQVYVPAGLGDREPAPGTTPATRHRPEGDAPPYPLLIVHDGEDFLRHANLRTVLDNLVHRRHIEPTFVALTQPADRNREYTDDPAHARYLAEELLPVLERRYPAGGAPDRRVLLGASFGAVASLAASWRHPGTWDSLVLLSGSFASIARDHRPVADFVDVKRFVRAFRARPGRPARRAFVACGLDEALVDDNRAFLPVLRGAGIDVRYVESRDGHHWQNWRDRLGEGLPLLFPARRLAAATAGPGATTD